MCFRMKLDNMNPTLYGKGKKKNENYSLGQIPSHHNIILDLFNMKKEKKKTRKSSGQNKPTNSDVIVSSKNIFKKILAFH